jgi:transposase
MFGPGEYVPDRSAGILTPEDLPQAKIVRRSRTYRHCACPRCGNRCGRDRVFTRVLHDVGDLVAARPRDIHLVYAQYHCSRCRKYFTADMSDYAVPKAQYTHRVVSLAVRLVVEDGLPYHAASWHLWRDHRVFVPFATIQNWVEAGGEKGSAANVDKLSQLGSGRLLGVHRGR